MSNRSVIKRTFIGVAWLATALLALGAAWLACNNRWVDAPVSEVPQALQPPLPVLPRAHNGFYALVELDQSDADRRLDWPGGSDELAAIWSCNSEHEDCVGQWRAHAQALSVLAQRHAVIGQRCVALAADGFAMEEILPAPSTELHHASDQYAAKMQAPHAHNANRCARWLRVQAVLAQQRGDQAAMRAYLRSGDALSTGLLRGSHSLIGSVIAWRIAEEQWQTVVALAAAQPDLAIAMAAFIPVLPAEALDPSRWIVSEAWFARQISRELGLGCELAEPGGSSPAQVPLVCRPNVTFMPNATQQLFDAHWLQALAMARGGPLALLDWSPAPPGLRFFGVTWRNTVGHLLVDVAVPAWSGYAARQANLLLQQHAATLALQAAAVAPSLRPAWLARQPIEARLRPRLRLDGSHIVASTWPKNSSGSREIRFPIPSMQDT